MVSSRVVPQLRLRRFVAVIIFSIGALLLVAITGTQISQRLKRRQAEKLLAEIFGFGIA
jgi:hypothetical protein